MARVVAIGSADQLDGFALVGVEVVHAPSSDAARQAWRTLAADVGLVILSPAAAAAIGDETDDRVDVLTAVVP